MLARLARSISLFFLQILLLFIVLSVLLVASLRWFDPPASAFMAQHLIGAWQRHSSGVYLFHDWSDWEAIAPSAPLAIIAAEDQRFPHHHGFDWVEIKNALKDYRAGGKLRGASTLSQQVAKNLFLWPGKNLLRKGLESWFTLLIEASLPKQRILEIYMNIAQFSKDTFGVGAAALRYFGKSAARLNEREASLLAAVLPNPVRFKLDAPSAHLIERSKQIRRQMKNLGSNYLAKL